MLVTIKYLLAFLICILVFTNNGLSQTSFHKTIGGTGNDNAWDVQKTNDGGYILVGVTTSWGAGNTDVWLVKTDSLANVLWMKTFGGAGADDGAAVRQTSDGGYILTASTQSFGAGMRDIWLIKTDAAGNMTWNKTYGGPNNNYAYPGTLTITNSGGYIFGGESWDYSSGGAGYYIVNTDNAGNVIFNKGIDLDCCWNGAEPWRIIPLSNGDFLVGGHMMNMFGNWEPAMFWLNAAGTLINHKYYSKFSSETIYDLETTSDGGYISVGYWNRNLAATHYEAGIMKMDAFGNMQWTKSFSSTSGSDYETFYHVTQTNDGGYAAIGSTNVHGAGSSDALLTRMDANGNQIWSMVFGGASSDHFNTGNLFQTWDGGFFIFGATSSFGLGGADVYIVKTNASGNTGCNEVAVNLPTKNPIVTVTTSTHTELSGGSINSGGISTTPISATLSLCTTLPVEWLDFSADCEKNDILLSWSTASETNNDYFNIEQSSDGLNWNEIGKINGAGNSTSQKNYSFSIENTTKNFLYFRLKQTDFDGNYEYSEIAVSNCGFEEEGVLLFPNPAANTINLIIDIEETVPAEIQIMDCLGQIVHNSQLQFSEGKNHHVLDLSAYESGIYFIIVNYNGKFGWQKRFIKS